MVTFEDLTNDTFYGFRDFFLQIFAKIGWHDDKSNNVGLAWGKTVCNPSDNLEWGMSINAWDPDMTTFANTVAHEIGHNLGMEHDHEPNHKAKGCDKQGIMSYGGNWIEWSTCSRDDFTNHYRTRNVERCYDVKVA